MGQYDRIIIGAGLYGLYAALFCCRRGMNVLVLECDEGAFGRATQINQARVHQGYHYPRSLSTAMRSAQYFERFCRDYSFCINSGFEQIYATSAAYSWTDAEQFIKFCEAARIPCERLHPERYFRPGMCSGAFLTREYTYDAAVLREYFLGELAEQGSSVTVRYGARIVNIEASGSRYEITLKDGSSFSSSYVLNASYAGINQIIDMIGGEKFRIKYELCELILCDADDMLRGAGITVMDGPFFSVMPYGMTGMHSLTAVTFTPHTAWYGELPEFECQERSAGYCNKARLGNCNTCPAHPETAFPYMESLARKYLRDELGFTYRSSLYSMKPILMSSEIDDSRPTMIRVHTEGPVFVSVLSGKINTVYDLDEVLTYGD